MRTPVNCSVCRKAVFVDVDEHEDPELNAAFLKLVVCDLCALNKGRRRWYRSNRKWEEVKA